MSLSRTAAHDASRVGTMRTPWRRPKPRSAAITTDTTDAQSVSGMKPMRTSGSSGVC
jgi:hypothetical protein